MKTAYISFKNNYNEVVDIVINDELNLMDLTVDGIKILPKTIDKTIVDSENLGFSIKQSAEFTNSSANSSDPNYLPTQQIKRLILNKNKFKKDTWKDMMTAVIRNIISRIDTMNRYSNKEKFAMLKQLIKFRQGLLSYIDLIKMLPKY